MSSRTLLADTGGLRIWLDTDPSGNRNEVHIDEVPGRAADAIGVRFGSYARAADDNNGRPVSMKFSFDELTGSESAPDGSGVQAVAPRRSERMRHSDLWRVRNVCATSSKPNWPRSRDPARPARTTKIDTVRKKIERLDKKMGRQRG